MDEKREDIEENNFKKLESNEIEDTEKLNNPSEDKKEQDIEGSSGEQDSLFSEKKDDSPQDNKDIEAMQNKQLKWAVFLMASIILIIVIVPFVNTNFINKFDYHGLTFQKTQLGQIEFYSTKFPVVAATGKVTGEYAVNLRNDPREIEDIEVKVGFDDIDFRYYKNGDGSIGYYPVYISLDPLMEVCEDSSLALLTLSGFLKDSGLEVGSASMDKEYAAANDVLYKRCEEESTVILVTQGNENKITEIGETCYEIRFKDCDILKVSERFVLNILEQYGKRFQG
ncbi:MAG TPA: hypothetical protein QGG70_00820 [Candidatus Pacearchaeota archaeon]|nr:hypothetical protein [Candidatus Pacearchaeota archaeon]